MIDTPSLVSSFLLGNGANFTQNPGQEGWSRPQLGRLDCGSTRADQRPINTGRETRCDLSGKSQDEENGLRPARHCGEIFCK